MELRHLEYFVAVAEEENFTRAAQRLHIVQSAVSAAVKSLERELGSPLLDRAPRRVTLTDAGAQLLPHARATLDAARAGKDAVARVRGGLGGSLRIGVLISIRLVPVPGLLGEFHRRHPGVQLHTRVSPSGTQGLIELIAERRLDLAFVTPAGQTWPGIRLIELARSDLVLVVPAGHPLAGRAEVTMAELAGLDFIDSPAGFGNRAVTDRAFATAGIRRRVTIEITELAIGPDYVREGLGVALFPAFTAQGAPGVVAVPVADADLGFPVSLAVPDDRPAGAAARALIDQITRPETDRTGLE